MSGWVHRLAKSIGSLCVFVFFVASRNQTAHTDDLQDVMYLVQAVSPSFRCQDDRGTGQLRRVCASDADSMLYERSTADSALLQVSVHAQNVSEGRAYAQRLLDLLAKRGWRIRSCGTSAIPDGHVQSSLLVRGDASGLASVIESPSGGVRLMLVIGKPSSKRLERMCS